MKNGPVMYSGQYMGWLTPQGPGDAEIRVWIYGKIQTTSLA
jgi:hypothetical protein